MSTLNLSLEPIAVIHDDESDSHAPVVGDIRDATFILQ